MKQPYQPLYQTAQAMKPHQTSINKTYRCINHIAIAKQHTYALT